jgi:CheY-like chemotaxis protein
MGHILIVDDEADIRELLKYNLEKEGHTTDVAENGAVALDRIRGRKPDLILLDVMMPVMDGIQTCETIKEDHTNKDILICFLTARAEDYSQIAGLEAGGDDYIAKPIKTKVLELKSGKTSFETIYPGGLTALGTDIDPAHTKEDNLAGHIAGLVGTLPDVYSAITMTWTLTDKFDGNWSPKIKDKMYLQIGNINTEAELTDIELKAEYSLQRRANIIVYNHFADFDFIRY